MTTELPMGHGIKVLVLDSDITSLSKIYLGLLDRDYDVEATNEPEELMARIRRFRPDLLVLSDELLALEWTELRQQLNASRLPVILLSASDALSEEAAAAFHPETVLRKPVEVAELVQCFARFPAHR